MDGANSRFSDDGETETTSIAATDVYIKECWVCRTTEVDDENEEEWVEPCNCIGGSRFVHQSCLQRWIDNIPTNCEIKCKQCLFNYKIVQPKPNWYVRLLEPVDNLINILSPAALTAFACVGVWGMAVTYGISTVVISFGTDEGTSLIERMRPKQLYLYMPLIPLGLIMANRFHWEDYVLQSWHRNYHQSYLFRLLAMPAPPRTNQTSVDHLLKCNNSRSKIKGSTRPVITALLLPTVSALVGRILFSNVNPIIKRTLYGALTVVLFNGISRIYLRQYQFVIVANRRALDNPKTIDQP